MKTFKYLLISLVLLLTATVNAEELSYLNENGELTKLTGASTSVTSSLTSWSDGWYVVDESVTISDRIQVSGTVNLLLKNGVTLTAEKGINVASGTSFNVYAQSDKVSEMGSLNATGKSSTAGIGGESSETGGVITINGGTVTATGGIWSAGIGGGDKGAGGTITINGGTVTATGGNQGAGIGGGWHGAGGTIFINGGTVTATGGTRGAGIGGGPGGAGGTININGGTVIATGGHEGAGLGGGYDGDGGTITINGGTVTATGGSYGAGIGGGAVGECAKITINGGKVTAVAGSNSVGIGPGKDGGVSGSVILGWTNEDDFIYAVSYGNVETIKFADGKLFFYEENGVITTVDGTDNIGGKTLRPIYEKNSLKWLKYAIVSGVNPYYLYTGEEIVLTYKVTDIEGKELVEGIDYTAFLNNSSVNNELSVKDKGEYTLSITAKEGGYYTGSKRIRFSVCDEFPVTASTTAMTSGRYEVLSDVTIGARIIITGDVTLILDEGRTLTALQGIVVSSGNKLTIEGTGSLNATGMRSAAGIGGGSGETGGTITINGGTVTATGGYYGAGIGGGEGGSGGTITINGGTVTARGGYFGAGIGGGAGGAGGVTTINGGTVTAKGDWDGAGIGGGEGGSGGTITINGGSITATGDELAAGIGGGARGSGGVTTINGGTVTATAGCDGASIGGGKGGSSGTITINGGKVTAIVTAVWCSSVGVGSGYGASAIGSVTLGWTNEDDFIYASSYDGVETIKFADGKPFYYEESGKKVLVESVDNIGGKTLRPIYNKNSLEYAIISGVNPYYCYTGEEIALTYKVTDPEGKELVKGTDYTESFTPSPVQDAGDYTLTITAKDDGVYTGSKTVSFSVFPPYFINNKEDWDVFAKSVNEGETYSGKYIKLNANISVSTKVGVRNGSQDRAFSGVFDGGGHTITADITDNNNPGTALFGYISGAMIKNLILAGKISGGIHAAGIVGFSAGTGNKIDSCVVSATIDGGSHIGGILGHGLGSDIAIDNCVFKGKFVGGETAKGVLFGWGDDGGTKTVTNSMYIQQDGQNLDNLDLAKMDAGSVTVTDCYKTANVGNYGKLVYLKAPTNEISMEKTAWDGTKCYTVGASISGILSYYFYTGKEIALSYKITDIEGNDLIEGTDYTATFTPSPVKDVGDYTLTIAAKDGSFYTGSKSVEFSIVSIKGSGSEADPYIISNEKEWNYFATSVNEGKTYSGNFIKLDADISVSTKVGVRNGSQNRAFSGVFDGGGHTITADITDNNNPGTALFGYISGATIKNLTLAGNIAGDMHAAGIVGFSDGTGNKIENCIVSARINGGTHVGGILGHGLDGDIDIDNCVFKGKLVGGGTAKGVLFGWGDNGGTKRVTNSLYIQQDNQNTYNLDLAKMGAGSVTMTNCYKTANVGTYGMLAYLEVPANEILIERTAADGQKFYIVAASISGVRPYYYYTGDEIAVTYKVTDSEGKEIVAETDYTATFTPSLVKGKGHYMLTIAAKDGSIYTGSKTVSFSVILGGNGTEADPYIISNKEDWDDFAASVNEGETYSGKYIKLNADISVSTKVGVKNGSQDRAFSGVFDGGGHTITADITDNNNPGTSLFGYISGATIKNLTLAGKITGGIHAAGIVGYSDGTGNRIDSCVVSATIDGGSHIGGILGHGLSSDIVIENCIFKGKLVGGETAKGVLFGWGDDGGTKTVTNGLYIQQDGQNMNHLDLAKMSAGNVTMRNSYKAYLTAPVDEITMEMTAWDGTECVVAVPISGVKPYYLYTGDEIALTYKVTDIVGNELVEKKDYTASLDKYPIKDEGKYTFTITAKEGGAYTGKKTISFTVFDGLPVTATTTAMTSGKYGVFSDVTIGERIVITGDVTLILDEGKTLTALQGVEVSGENKLTIDGKGSLNATGGYYQAGIGVGRWGSGGTITINGGTVTATGGFYGAGIGGGGHGSGGTITINGGIVTATGGVYGAGIGSGAMESSATTTINISDGVGKIVAFSAGASCIGNGFMADGSVVVNFISNGNIVTGVAKDAILYDSGEGEKREIRSKNLNHVVSLSDDVKEHISVYAPYAVVGETVTLTLDGAVGASSLKVNDGSSDLALTDAGDGKWTFVMPERDVTVFARIVPTYSVTLPEQVVLHRTSNVADKSGKYQSGTVVSFRAKSFWTASNVSDGKNVLTPKDGIYSVTVGDADITIDAEFIRSSNVKLADIDEGFTAIDGDIMTGTTGYTVQISDGASVSLNDATFNGGIRCNGDATITLVGSNKTQGINHRAGIWVGVFEKTLTIKGKGSLEATGDEYAAGIGCSLVANQVNGLTVVNCGNVVVEGGRITAKGGKNAAGIGMSAVTTENGIYYVVGDIAIKGGTVNAVAGSGAAGIGVGYIPDEILNSGKKVTAVGKISIYDDIEEVDASSISETVTYMHGETDVSANKNAYFIVFSVEERQLIIPKGEPDYAIAIDKNMKGGTVTCRNTARAGDKVVLNPVPVRGYTLSSLSVKDEQGNDISGNNGSSTGDYGVIISVAGDEETEKEYSFMMPARNVVVSAEFVVAYEIVFDEGIKNGSVTADVVAPEPGDVVTLTAVPDEGYALAAFSVKDGQGNVVNVNDNTFVMPASKVIVSAVFSPAYNIAIDGNMENGSVTANKTVAMAGEKVTLTATPASGYSLVFYTVKDDAGNDVEVEYDSFTMPEGGVTVSAVFTIGHVVYLDTLKDDYTVKDGDILAGTTDHTISAKDNDVTFTLYHATINGGITTRYNTTIILEDSNYVAGTKRADAGIGLGNYKFTLTIKGNGKLEAVGGGDNMPGIGVGKPSVNVSQRLDLGNLVVENGTITAKGGANAAGIGFGIAAAYAITIGNIIINGGTVEAYGGELSASAGIGSGTNVKTVQIDSIIFNGGTVIAKGGKESEADIGEGNIKSGLRITTIAFYHGFREVSGKIKKVNARNIVYKNGENDVSDKAEEYFAITSGNNSRFIFDIRSLFNIGIDNNIAHGTIAATVASSNGKAYADEVVTLSATPKSGYKVDFYTVKDAAGNNIEVINNSFVMPLGDVTVSAKFVSDHPLITFSEDGKKVIIEGEYDGKDIFNIEKDITVEKVVFNREFTPNSGHATIMFPFDVKATSLTGVKSVIEFDGVKTDKNDNKTVGMRYVWCNATLGEQEELNKHPNCNGYSGELKAYTPYMIEMESATLGIKDAVTLKSNSGKIVGDAPVGNWVFRGTLQKKEWPKGTGIINEGRLWAFSAAERSGAKIGEFVQFGGNNWANPFRAYLVECKKTDNGLDCSDDDSGTQPKASLVSRYRFADALAPTDTAATDEPLVMRQAAASETASINSMDIVIVYGDKDSDKERPTVIGRYNPATGEIRMLPQVKQTYDLKGRKVGNGKKAKGAYYKK